MKAGTFALKSALTMSNLRPRDDPSSPTALKIEATSRGAKDAARRGW